MNRPNEWLPLVSEQSLEFIRVQQSQVGGIAMGRKIANLCEFFTVRTA